MNKQASFILSSDVEWFHHAKERMNHWHSLPRTTDNMRIANEWQREMTIAYGHMTKAERDSLPRR